MWLLPTNNNCFVEQKFSLNTNQEFTRAVGLSEVRGIVSFSFLFSWSLPYPPSLPLPAPSLSHICFDFHTSPSLSLLLHLPLFLSHSTSADSAVNSMTRGQMVCCCYYKCYGEQCGSLGGTLGKWLCKVEVGAINSKVTERWCFTVFSHGASIQSLVLARLLWSVFAVSHFGSATRESRPQ